MNLAFESAFLTNMLLVSVRLAGAFLFTPFFASAGVPVRIRIIFLISLAFLLTAVLPPTAPPATLADLFAAFLAELLLGGALAFGVFAAFGVFLFGGRILDFQMGFGVASLIDPATRTQSPLIGTILNMMAVAGFFLVNGHHLMLRGLAYSFERIPPGTGIREFALGPVVAEFGLMFTYGLVLVAPAVFALLLLDAGLAIAARTMPQINMFIVGLPLKIFVGLMVLAISLVYMGPFLAKVYASIFRYWEAFIQQVQPA